KSLYSLSDNLGKTGTVLVFFDCETPKAIEVMQLISQVAPNYNVDVMAVSKGTGTVEEQLNRIKENKITVFPHTLFDTDGEISKAYNITNTPVTYFIDKEGRITDAYIASISEKSLKKELDAID
ncbi:MAG: TlpA family protein disulfide reductase, partial [Clostridia bacterium]|nr:TlpA family protein disulfide reductase [Clostridia bacterium]